MQAIKKPNYYFETLFKLPIGANGDTFYRQYVDLKMNAATVQLPPVHELSCDRYISMYDVGVEMGTPILFSKGTFMKFNDAIAAVLNFDHQSSNFYRVLALVVLAFEMHGLDKNRQWIVNL